MLIAVPAIAILDGLERRGEYVIAGKEPDKPRAEAPNIAVYDTPADKAIK